MIKVAAVQKDTTFLLLAGQPIGEPIVEYGPFVVNDQAEIKAAVEDLNHGRNGFEGVARWWKMV